mgnify:CR=1 FL=1
MRAELANAQRKGDYQRAGELQYDRIPKIEKQLADAEKQSAAGAVLAEIDAVAHPAAGYLRRFFMNDRD